MNKIKDGAKIEKVQKLERIGVPSPASTNAKIKEAEKAAAAPKKEDKKPPVFGKKLDQVLKENEELKKKLAKQAQNEKPVNFEELRKYYQERNRKIKALGHAEAKNEELEEILQTVEKSLTSGDFEEVPDIHFSIYAPKGEYKQVKEIIKISNYSILKDVVKFVNTLMIEKIENLKEEIKA